MVGSPSIAVEQLDEVLGLRRHQRGQRGVALGGDVGEDDPLDQRPPVAEEHVLGAAQPDALGAHPAGPVGVGGGVGVRPHPHPAYVVGVA